MKRDLVVAERASEITAAVECRESHRLAIICHGMHEVSLYGQCRAYHAASEAESLMHFDNRCVVAQNRWARNSRALRERDRAHPSIQVFIMVRIGRCSFSSAYNG